MSSYGRVRRSPPKQLVFSGKNTRTFPSLLEDISQTPQSTHLPNPASAARSPDKMSPVRVRTTKEYEEEMAALKRENFNLKLRIYFMQERREQLNCAEDVEALIKSNTELKVELETLKKDLADKEDLLVQTAKAIELLKQTHKANIDDLIKTHNEEKEDLQTRIDKLLKDMKDSVSTPNFDDSSAMYAVAFGLNPRMTGHGGSLHHCERIEDELKEERKKNKEIVNQVESLVKDIQTMKDENDKLQTSMNLLQTELDYAKKENQKKTESLSVAIQHLKSLEETVSRHENTIMLKDEKISELEDQKEVYHEHMQKEKSILSMLEAELEAANKKNANLRQEELGMLKRTKKEPRSVMEYCSKLVIFILLEVTTLNCIETLPMSVKSKSVVELLDVTSFSSIARFPLWQAEIL